MKKVNPTIGIAMSGIMLYPRIKKNEHKRNAIKIAKKMDEKTCMVMYRNEIKKTQAGTCH